MNIGSIAVLPQPFYRHAHTHPRREYHLTEGWFHDKIRAEYELFFADLDVDHSDPKQVEGVTRFIRERTTPAYLQGVRFGKIKGESLTQRYFLLRARAYGLVTEDQLVEWERQNIFHVIADRLRTILECLPQVRKLVVDSTPVQNHFASVFRQRLQKREVEVISVEQDQWLKRVGDDSEFLLAEKHKTVAERTRHLDGNVLPGHQAALFDLIASLRLTRKQLNLTV